MDAAYRERLLFPGQRGTQILKSVDSLGGWKNNPQRVSKPIWSVTYLYGERFHPHHAIEGYLFGSTVPNMLGRFQLAIT